MLKLSINGHAAQRAVRPGRDGGRPLQEWRKLLSVALARNTAATATGHKALRRAYRSAISVPIRPAIRFHRRRLNTRRFVEKSFM